MGKYKNTDMWDKFRSNGFLGKGKDLQESLKLVGELEKTQNLNGANIFHLRCLLNHVFQLGVKEGKGP